MKYGIAGIIIVGVIAGGLFYYQYTDKKEHEGNIRSIVTIREELKKTTERLDAEQAKLDDLEVRKNRNNNLNSDIRSSYEQARGIVNEKTDIFFKDANGTSPELNIKTKDNVTKKLLDQKRTEINEALALWVTHIDTATSVELRANLVLESNRNIGIIAAYIDSLGNVVAGLTPQNSGLSQTQISTYTNTVAQASTAIEELTAPTVVATPTTSSGQTGTPTSNNTGGAATNTSSDNTSSNASIVTAAQIEAELEAQRAIVAQAAAAAAALALELAQAEAQAAAAAAAAAQTQVNTQNQSNPQNQSQSSSTSVSSNPQVTVPGDPVPVEHITIPEQFYPDEPQLIQGW